MTDADLEDAVIVELRAAQRNRLIRATPIRPAKTMSNAPKCAHCGQVIEPPGIPDPPYDDSKDHVKCDDCKGSGNDPVTPGTACVRCDGSGWL